MYVRIMGWGFVFMGIMDRWFLIVVFRSFISLWRIVLIIRKGLLLVLVF